MLAGIIVTLIIGEKNGHPHACGENSGINLNFESGTGSPPRVWGKWYCYPHLLDNNRITPTRVGIMYGYPGIEGLPEVHPHACGYMFASPATQSASMVHPHACGDY